MIRTSFAEADERDLQAMAPPGNSLVRNVLSATLPISAVVFLVIYAVSRSPWAAGCIAVGVMTASMVSNVRFFRTVARRRTQQTDRRAVEVIDVEASRVFDIEPLGSHGPALVFFAEEGKALILIGQWLLEQPVFPTKSFILRRWADTGMPIRIDVRGPEIVPEEVPIQIPDASRVRDIWLIDATPDSLDHDLQRAFA